MLEEFINVKLAMKKNKSKAEVKKRFIQYSRAYDNCENKTIKDKLDFRDVRYDYYRYMAKSGDGSKSIIY